MAEVRATSCVNNMTVRCGFYEVRITLNVEPLYARLCDHTKRSMQTPMVRSPTCCAQAGNSAVVMTGRATTIRESLLPDSGACRLPFPSVGSAVCSHVHRLDV